MIFNKFKQELAAVALRTEAHFTDGKAKAQSRDVAGSVILRYR